MFQILLKIWLKEKSKFIIINNKHYSALLYKNILLIFLNNTHFFNRFQKTQRIKILKIIFELRIN